MSLLPNFLENQDFNLSSENPIVNDPCIPTTSNHLLPRSDLPLSRSCDSLSFSQTMQQQYLEFERRREETKLLQDIHRTQVNNFVHLNSRVMEVQSVQDRTESQIKEVRKDVTEIKMLLTLLNRTQSPVPSPRSDCPDSPPHKPGGTTTVHCEVMTECCNTKVTIPLEYLPGRSRYEDKYHCSICKKSLGKNYYQKHVQGVCLRKKGCPNCQPSNIM